MQSHALAVLLSQPAPEPRRRVPNSFLQHSSPSGYILSQTYLTFDPRAVFERNLCSVGHALMWVRLQRHYSCSNCDEYVTEWRISNKVSGDVQSGIVGSKDIKALNVETVPLLKKLCLPFVFPQLCNRYHQSVS